MADSAQTFVTLLKETSGLDATIDRPTDPLGESFIDIVGPGVETQVSYRPSVGFGFFTESDSFGQRPDTVIRGPIAAAKYLVAQTRAPADKGHASGKQTTKAQTRDDVAASRGIEEKL